MKNTPLPPSQLYKPCNLEHLKFDSTDELEDIDITLGQERAMEAIKFGIHIHKSGYNILPWLPPARKVQDASEIHENTLNVALAKVKLDIPDIEPFCPDDF